MSIKVVVASVLIGLTVIMGYTQIRGCIVSDYRFEKQYLYAWNLADKSSTIEAKAKYISEFVGVIQSNKTDFSAYNAMWMETPDNSFENNLEALVTLKNRLAEIQKMDVKSFEYQTAIQQITAQEQGEATKLITTIKECWIKEKYISVWNWVAAIWTISTVVFGGIAVFLIMIHCTEY